MDAVFIPVSAEKSISPPHQKMKRRNSPTLKPQTLASNSIHGRFFNFPPHHQPPLLPLPNPPPPSRISSFQNPNKSLTPKKSKSRSNSIKRNRDSEELDKKSTSESMTEIIIVDSTNRLGPEPSHLPKDISRVLSTWPSKEMEFSGSVFSLSPPPSSVPLPKFSLRPKIMSCKMEAASAPGIDAGATDNLRRLLRLR